MSKGKIPQTSDPLLRALLDSGRARIHTVDGVHTHSLDATRAELGEEVLNGHNLIAADGTVDETVVVLGIRSEERRVGKEGRARGAAEQWKKKKIRAHTRTWERTEEQRVRLA